MYSTNNCKMLPSEFRRKFDFIHQDAFLLDCPTYDSYLRTFVTKNDERYLIGYETDLKLVKQGYRTTMDVYTPGQYKKKKAHVELLYFGGMYKPMKSLSVGLTIEDPVMQQLALREQLNIDKTISTIIHLKDVKSIYHISGYIDFQDSLNMHNLEVDGARNWSAIFAGRLMLRPRITDLSFCHLHRGQVHYNNTDNYNVIHSSRDGLVFMHRGDHKIICVNPNKSLYRENRMRKTYFSEKYGYVIIYDHLVRRKA